jgi:hypothetical protein
MNSDMVSVVQPTAAVKTKSSVSARGRYTRQSIVGSVLGLLLVSGAPAAPRCARYGHAGQGALKAPHGL